MSNPISAGGFVGTVSPGVGFLNVGLATSGPTSLVTLNYAISPNLNLSGFNYFLFSFSYAVLPSTLGITVTTTGGTLTGSYALPGSVAAFDYVAYLSSLSGSGDLSNITGLTLRD